MNEKIRKEILYFLENNKNHPTTDDIINYVKNKISNVDEEELKKELNNLLKERKVITALIVNKRNRFEKKIQPHYHFICQKCGGVKDVFIEYGAIDMVADHVQKITKSFAKIEKVNMSFQGICHQCRGSSN